MFKPNKKDFIINNNIFNHERVINHAVPLFMFDDTAGYVVYVFVSGVEGCGLRQWTLAAPAWHASALCTRWWFIHAGMATV